MSIENTCACLTLRTLQTLFFGGGGGGIENTSAFLTLQTLHLVRGEAKIENTSALLTLQTLQTLFWGGSQKIFPPIASICKIYLPEAHNQLKGA